MATAAQIKALIKSHLERDDERFVAIALQVAAHAARQGHGRLADEIRALVDEARERREKDRRPKPIPITTPRGELVGLLGVSYPRTRLSDMVLDSTTHGHLHRILREQRAQDKLMSHGLEPRRKLLLIGPPGSGKTMTASALAGELHVPLYVIMLHGLITKFMGETAAKLRLVFDALSENRGVYLFDEFDAIGVERGSQSDVGEIRRVLNSFLLFLEQDESSSLIVAATNHPQTLDTALFRRFDDVVEYQHPPPELVEQVLKNKLAAFEVKKLDWGAAATTAKGLSYAEITRACEAAAKELILNDWSELPTEALVSALQERQQARRT